MKLTAIYPGTFDPITNGHTDIVERAARMFDMVIVAIAGSTGKSTTFSTAERVALARESLTHVGNVEVASFSGLMTTYAKQRGAAVIVRGLRAVSDFEYEFQMASMNRQLYHQAETVFLIPDEHLNYISSSLVREIAALGGDVTRFVSAAVNAALHEKFSG
ncbi:MAG: pantetheine-phosphate adenylyltransferase [Gammaproteobacteria bacterium]|nr:pantetheine-phosphate adenylyltransferase [Gammaproteobacteria bacterium]MDE0284105.1 pantetheine-phosphate adenylyltransferase [Gammaproteobacteria bacterium]MDE0513976.1 pantetheine-phosphate adenylyltransferase [Gammaproteobacteria bacterium]